MVRIKLVRIKYGSDAIKIMSLFSSMTKTEIEDYIKNEDGSYIFIVKNGQISRAIGKNGSNAKRLEAMLKNKVKIVEFSGDKLEFVKNLIYPFKAKEIKEEENTILITPIDLMTRGLLIGKGGQKLRNYENIIKRFFDIKELKVTSA